MYLNTSEVLTNQGHEVIHFSTISKRNFFSPTSRYFIKNPDYANLSTKSKIISIGEYLYSQEAKKNLCALLEKERPDIVHIHIFFGELSNSILTTLKQFGIPIVMTLHDFKMLCPVYLLLDNNGKICERCASGNHLHCIRKRCHQNNVFSSTLMAIDNFIGRSIIPYEDYIDHFIAVSDFCMQKHINFRPKLKNKISRIYNFIDLPLIKTHQITFGDYYLYFGRLSREKGILTLIRSLKNSNIPLWIVGEGPEEVNLREYCKINNLTNVHFKGFKNRKELKSIIKNARFSVFPSECYESFGLGIIESMSQGTPPISAYIGGAAELILNEKDGFYFRSKDENDLRATILKTFEIENHLYKEMSIASIQAAGKYSKQNYYNELIKTYDSIKHSNAPE